MKNCNFRKVGMLPSQIKFIFVFIVASVAHLSYGQILTNYPCYSISEDNGAPNVLFAYDPATQQWNSVGETGGSFIEAIATDPLTNTIYAVDGDMFGTVDPQTGQFLGIGKPGIAIGDKGRILLDDIDGLTYYLNEKIMYASYRIPGTGPGTNDLLFQIDVATGNFIPGAMLDNSGNAADYAVIEDVLDLTFASPVYDVDDIAINPYTGKLFAIQNQDGPSTITEIDPLTGRVIQVVFDIPDDDVEGLGFTYFGELYATTGDNGICSPGDPSDISCLNNFIYIDLENGTTTVLNVIDPTNTHVDFESFDCFTSFNDLALVYRLADNTPAQIKPGDQITFNVTVYNQGGFVNENIAITNYIPEGLTLADANWVNTSNGKASYTIKNPLQTNDSVTIPVTFKIDEDFEGSTLKSIAEISSSSNSNVINNLLSAKHGSSMASLPDIDSTPDDINNEVNVIDDEINGNGMNSNISEDEDDHDIAVVAIDASNNNNSNCASSINLNSAEIDWGVYQAAEYITCTGNVVGPSISFTAGTAITFDEGFILTKSTFLSASIGGCQ